MAHRLTFSGRSYKFVHYHVNRETERIDFPEIERLAAEHKPKLIMAGYTAYPRIIDFERFAALPIRSGPSSWWIWRILPVW